MATRLKIAVLCGGPSSEYEVSLNTARLVFKNLDRRTYIPTLVTIERSAKWKFGNNKSVDIGGAIAKLKRFDFVFIAMHGAFGEDGHVQSLLEWIGVPYSGSSVLSSAMAMDKGVSNILYRANDLKVPRYIVIERKKKNRNLAIRFPVIIKPVSGGSSVGMSIIKSKKDLHAGIVRAFKENEQVILQEYIKGREFTCGVLEDKRGKPFALPPTEIIPKSSSFFDYAAKYKAGGSQEITPARLPKEKIKELQQLALGAHTLLGCRGMSRSDFILRGSIFYILETNTIPGMTETSLLPQAAKVAGISFAALLDLIITLGFRKV